MFWFGLAWFGLVYDYYRPEELKKENNKIDTLKKIDVLKMIYQTHIKL